MQPIPPNEEIRLKRLDESGIMYTEPSRNFDRLCELARDLFEVPIALVTILGRHEQWFKAKVGLEMGGTPREHAVCAYTILKDEVFVVEDAIKDPRFRSHPMVTGPMAVRFYAGAPIVFAPNIHFGAVCIVDVKPRKLTPLQVSALKNLGETAGTEIRLLHAVRQLHRTKLKGCGDCRIKNASPGAV